MTLKIISDIQANLFISQRIETNAPTMIARFGSTEANYLSEFLFRELGFINDISSSASSNMKLLSGFFSIDNPLIANRFCEEMLDAIADIDLLGYWTLGRQEMLIDAFGKPDCRLASITSLEPYLVEEGRPWSSSLAGKRVIVVHPFATTIETQYAKREKIWTCFEPNAILPPFEMRTVRAVQTLAGQKDERFVDWFAALDYMESACFKSDFDVAIIGCGAYGMLLASRIKRRGKIAIHLGGATQILFGIRGKRWDAFRNFDKFYNPFWVRASGGEVISDKIIVEGGCYW